MNQNQRKLFMLRIRKYVLLQRLYALNQEVRETNEEIGNAAMDMTLDEMQEVDKFYKENIIEKEK